MLCLFNFCCKFVTDGLWAPDLKGLSAVPCVFSFVELVLVTAVLYLLPYRIKNPLWTWDPLQDWIFFKCRTSWCTTFGVKCKHLFFFFTYLYFVGYSLVQGIEKKNGVRIYHRKLHALTNLSLKHTSCVHVRLFKIYVNLFVLGIIKTFFFTWMIQLF